MRHVFFSILMISAFQSLNAQGSPPPVYVVLFTHIEDNTPAAEIGTPQARQQYLSTRNAILEMAWLANRHGVTWVFQPDWKLLLAALVYEDAATTANTGGKNFLRYLREDLSVPVDPHSHEAFGYNYTDVAHLLDSLGVPASTVIGGHIWDPTIPQFSEWDRFRVPLRGSKYPWALWRGDILMGSGTPNHVNDPTPSGVWRPKDRNNYWEDDPAGNIHCVGQYKGDVAGVQELVDLYARDVIASDDILTASIHILPLDFTRPGGLKVVEDSIIKPLTALRDERKVELTDFTSLIGTWKTKFSSRPHLYIPDSVTPAASIETYIPSEAGGSEGIFAEIIVPDSSRYPEGAPVVVHVAGGWSPEGLSAARDARTPGFIEIRYNFPGGGPAGRRSGGVYDDRGEQCIKATRDVLRFAMGRTRDRNGKYIGELTGTVTPISTNVGMCGWSNGGNATITTAGAFGDDLTGLAWIANWESPVGDGMPSVEAGGNQKLNPAYDPLTGTWDLQTLAFSDTMVITRPGISPLRGGLYFDINRNGRPDLPADFLLTPYLTRMPAEKVYYSVRVSEEAERRGLIPAGAPAHLTSAEETRRFWSWRNAEKHIAPAINKNPGLMSIICASDTDHVQGAPDHPHVLTQYGTMLDAGARFVRLNPDRAYCEYIGGTAYPRAADNDAYRTFTHANVVEGLEPEGVNKIPDIIFTSAAIVELADRTRHRVLLPNLDATIDPNSTTGIRREVGVPGYEMTLSPNPLRDRGTLSVFCAIDDHVTLRMYDIMGRERAVLHNDRLETGTHVFALPLLPPGVYVISLTSRRLTLLLRLSQL